MRATSENKDTIDKIHLLSGESKQSVRNLFEALASLIILNYMEKESTNIPFLGNIILEQHGNEITKEGKVAIVDIKIEPDNNLLKNIGQIDDGEETEIEKIFKRRIQESLRNYIQ